MSLRLRVVVYQGRGFLIGFFLSMLAILGCGTDAVGNFIGIDPVPHTPETDVAPTGTVTATPTAS